MLVVCDGYPHTVESRRQRGGVRVHGLHSIKREGLGGNRGNVTRSLSHSLGTFIAKIYKTI